MKNIKLLLGKRIKELRKRKKLTQDQLAEIIGIEPRNILKIENAQTFPRVQTLEKLADAFECTAKELFSFEHLDEIEEMRQKVIDAVQKDDDIVKLVYKMIV